MRIANLKFILSICSILAKKICSSSAKIEAKRKPTMMNMLLVIEADTLYREAGIKTMKLFP
jgi:tRNA A37 threonylcarbamoyladenosine synthetase subunit TsaC/SUA5/YrdC